MTHVFHPSFLLSIASRPVRNGWVAVEDGRVTAVGGPSEQPPPGRRVGLESEAILPGLVNAHTHLELSWMRDRVAPGTSMPEWAGRLIALRATVDDEPSGPIERAVAEVRACGTTLVGDVCNTLAVHPVLARSPLSARVFREVLGFRVEDAGPVIAGVREELSGLPASPGVRCSIVPHAPYSVSPALLAAIARASDGQVVSVHAGESAEEIEFLRTGTGRWRDLLERMDAWNPAWPVPGCGPIEYLGRFGLVHGGLLAVHGVHLTDAELVALAEAGATVVTCPRSNVWTGAGVPPIARFYASGVRVAVGTDSLASVADLNLFSEIAAMRAAAPDVPAATLLESATRSGADALGFGADLGTIEPGKRAELVAVRIPPDVRDVEEYLVSGITAADIRWIVEPEP